MAGALNSAVECHLHTVEVIGSNPIAPTIVFCSLRRLPTFASCTIRHIKQFRLVSHAQNCQEVVRFEPFPQLSPAHGVHRRNTPARTGEGLCSGWRDGTPPAPLLPLPPLPF